MLVASSRTSRFADNDIGINLQTVNISVGDKNLLVDAHLQLKTGVHYSLLGRNGVGKSILMHCLVTGLLLSPELRSSLRIMLIRQTLEDSEDDPELGAEPKTVMEELETRPFGADFIMSEKERWALKAQQQSGARGKYAREMLLQFESLCESAEASSTSDFDDYYDDPTPAMIMSTAKSLRITEAMLKRPLRELSGGWKMRVQLAKALLYKPDLLLLDEPTNHLDIAGISWLEKTIKEQFEGVTLLIVSHNRSFLNAVTEETILFKNQKLEYFKGNYDSYLQVIEEKTLFNERMQESLDKKKAHMKQSIEKSSKLAHKHGDDKRMRQVATKKFKLEERVGYERNEKGHRFKLNRDRAGFHNTTRGEVEHIEDENKQTVLRFNIPSPEQQRTHGPLLSVEDISFERRHPKTKERIFALEHITFNVSAGQRVAILGANGQGKSTLLNLLAAAWHPIRGSIQRKSSQIGYFRQEVVTELGKITASPLERLVELEPQQPQKELWKHLGSFGLGAQTIATKTEINQMSGGQRVAFAFAELTCTSPPPSLLLLDEPNSHLDLDALEALETSLNEYEGGIVFVSHDISFIKNVATDAYWISGGKMRKIELDEIDSLAMGSGTVAGTRKK